METDSQKITPDHMKEIERIYNSRTNKQFKTQFQQMYDAFGYSVGGGQVKETIYIYKHDINTTKIKDYEKIVEFLNTQELIGFDVVDGILYEAKKCIVIDTEQEMWDLYKV